ncbi:hypothetical protein [uncultured Tateyamaria sp.]|uniref:hypothetical protein n=1 Tax=uncultured Tateyamaria sp. TaxID=455651 RepID=UPI0026246332|nr:hypothetical protein [uncultured Tateyamaria sp.]
MTNLPSAILAYRDTTKGSPWIVTREGLQVIAERTRNAVSIAQIATELGMSPRTLDRLIATDEDVQDAIAMGKGSLETEVVSLILESAREGDGAQQRFLARNVLGFRDTGRDSQTSLGKQQPAVQIVMPPPMSDDQLEAMLVSYRDVTPPEDDEPRKQPARRKD